MLVTNFSGGGGKNPKLFPTSSHGCLKRMYMVGAGKKGIKVVVVVVVSPAQA